MEQKNNRGRNPQPVENKFALPQPQAVEIEKAVLGAQMIDKDAYPLISGIVKPETYYDPRHQKIQEAIITLSVKEKPVDILTITEQLARLGYLEDVGGPAYVVELSSKVASSANVEYHASIIAQKALARQLRAFGGTIAEKASDETNDIDDVMEEASDYLYEISKKSTQDDCKPFGKNVSDAINIIKEAGHSPDGITGVPSFKTIDEITHGWQKTDLIIIAGRPAMGKTSFGLSLVRVISAFYGKPCGFFSLEMNRVQLTKRLISNICEIDGNLLESGRIDSDGWDRIYDNGNILCNAPIFIDDTPQISISRLRDKAKRMVRENKVEIIFIDYLQLMTYNGVRFNSRQEEVSQISKSLKALAKELNVPIVALSQLNRGVEARTGLEGKRPLLSDLRESGAIEQDADVVVFVHRPEYYHIYQDDMGHSLIGKAEIIFAKNRKGPTTTILMDFEGNFTRFDDKKTI